ncbi:PREDICTED: uncharacterized protein LOC109177240 [Ipomoea nil]|uniref:uncharacterized protein LOC109177240 n=1 Tax=Ipomoea nil TaxID=35883 RepID=UPI000901C59F|nr:PREDICTED: uncharacterized protein LOC109177240 [Ipomoea nil]
MANKPQERKCPNKSDFFVKTSEKRHQKRQKTEQLCLGSAEENDKASFVPELDANMKTPPRKQKRQANSTPEKTPNSAEKRQAISTEEKKLKSDEPSSNVIPDLRKEARKTAEESSRIYAGKEIHPFFSSWKIGKRKNEAINLEKKWSTSEKEEKTLTLVPIHVLETVEEDAFTPDWQQWTFSERCLLSDSYILEHGCSPIYEGSVSSLQFDTFRSLSNPFRPLPYQNEISVDQHSVSQKEVCLVDSPGKQHLFHPTSPILLAEEKIQQECFKNSEDNEIETLSSFLKISGCVSSDTDKHDRFLGGGLIPHNQSFHNQPENCLWTDKYQPEKAVQVCGNGVSVKILSEWLHSWHERGSQRSKSFRSNDTFIEQEVGDDDYLSDCDSDNEDTENHLKNVLLVTGPVGSGKSAAIYACAKEQGFQVIEVNASDWRNGALVKQMVGEALESQWRQRTQKDTANAEDNTLLRSFSAAVTGTEGPMSEVIELIPILDDEDSQNASATPRKLICKDRTNSHGDLNTLVLFEDVDAALCEDRGFISTIQQLSETAKRPMILTSNSNNPVLPNNLDRLELCFTMPSSKDLLELANTVCNAEKVIMDSSLVEGFVNHCEGDIRKTIMLLQFWCQGQTFRIGNEIPTYRPLQFDIDAGHLMLLKLIPWSFPCPLSVLVDEEISKSMRVAEKSFTLGDIVEEDQLNGSNIWNSSKKFVEDPSSINAKKEAMLTLHGSLPDENELTAKFDSNTECSNYSGSPVAFHRRNTRRKLDTVFSDSDDEECLSSRNMIDLNKVPCDNCDEENEMMWNSPSDVSSTKMDCSLSSEPHHFKPKRLKRNCWEADDYSHPNGMSIACDLSCVPESSFVPESRLSSESYVDVNCKVEADCMNDSLPSIPRLEDDNLEKPVLVSCKNRELLGCSSDINTMSVCGDEASHYNVHQGEDSSGGCQLLDECSRIDFNWRFITLSNDKHHMTNSVQETWRKLSKGHMDLKQYVTPDQKDASKVLSIGYKLSNLISEADLLSNDCQQLIYDSLEPSMIPCDKLESYSWPDDQLHMSSIIAQHGICLFAKEIANLELDNVSVNQLDLASEMLASSDSTMALGKRVGLDRREILTTELRPPKNFDSSKRKLGPDPVNLLQLAVPLRSHLSLKGDALHEYLSSFSQISRLEANRLSSCVGRSKQRRARVNRHYLASGGCSLSEEDISLLCQYNCYHNDDSSKFNLQTS